MSGLRLGGSADLGRLGDVATGLDVHWAYVSESESKVDGILQPGISRATVFTPHFA